METRSDTPGDTRHSGIPSTGTPRGRVRVLHVITDLSTGGSQMALWTLLSRIDRDRFDPFVVCLKNGNTPLAEKIRSLYVPVVDLELSSPRRISRLLRLYRFIHDARPAIVHAWLFHAVFASRLIARMTGVPIVISARRNINLGSPLREKLNRWTAGLDDRVIAVSEAARRIEIGRTGVSAEKVIVIPNGVEVRHRIRSCESGRSGFRSRFGFPSESRVIATAGRLHPSKGIDDFLRAAAIVSRRHPEARFIIAGDGPERAALEQLSIELGLAPTTLFLGNLRNIDLCVLLTGIDIFALASREEGMPNAVLEAMATALPVVATAIGGTPEIIEHDVSGLLIPPGDVGALAASIEALLENPAKAAAMATAARHRVAESFSIETMVRRTQDLYEELLREKSIG